MKIENNNYKLSHEIIENENIDIKQIDQQQINEIDNFYGNEEEFEKLNEKLEQPFNHEIIYSDNIKNMWEK